MYNQGKMYFLQSHTSVHPGSGNELGVIDLPIQREKHTGFPKIEGSSLKGAIRETLESIDEVSKSKIINAMSQSTGAVIDITMFGENIERSIEAMVNYDHTLHLLFGYDDDTPGYSKKIFGARTEFAGALSFTDARLLLFPVKTMKGVFCRITCPYVLNRLQEDLALTRVAFSPGTITVAQGQCLVTTNAGHLVNNHAILEEYAFSVQGSADAIADELKKLGLPEDINTRLVVLHDDDYRDFVTLSTEVITRIKIDSETGTVKKGQLFNEEYLPPESILYFLTMASAAFGADEVKGVLKSAANTGARELQFFHAALPAYFQLGSNATIGKGIVKVLRLAEKE